MTIHHVISSRPLKQEGNSGFTYVRSLIATEKNADAANEFLSFGHYHIQDEIRPPFFGKNGTSTESSHFIHQPEGFQFPGEETIPYFTEIFTSLKQNREKQLYIYLFGFGNTVHSEMNKQLEPLHRYYYDNESWGSPVGKILLLSWPSQGKLEYKKGEKNDVRKMGRMLAALFVKLAHYVNDPNNPLFEDWQPKIVLHAQSMGCFILHHVSMELELMEKNGLISESLLNGFFHRVVLTGADLPEDTLKNETNSTKKGIHSLGKRVLLFHNEKDKALWISRVIFRSEERLGGDVAPDPSELPRNVDLISLTNMSNAGTGHDYFQTKESVMKRLFLALKDQYIDGSPLEDGKNLYAEFDVDADRITGAEWSA